MDTFVPVAPANALLVLTVLLHPSRWRSAPLWFAAGATCGSVALALLADVGLGAWGLDLTRPLDPRLSAAVSAYGAAGLFLLACLPLSIRTVILAAAFVGMPIVEFALAVGGGRLVGFTTVSAAARFCPDALRRFGPVRRALDRLPTGPCASSAEVPKAG